MSDYEYESDTEEVLVDESIPQPPKKQFIPPCKTTKLESDLEDIVIDGMSLY